MVRMEAFFREFFGFLIFGHLFLSIFSKNKKLFEKENITKLTEIKNLIIISNKTY
jgi:hypothetical protein